MVILLGMQDTKQTAGKPQSKLRRFAGSVLRYLLGLIITVVVLILAIYLREVYLLSQFEPTGDALFDRYGREVLNRQSWRLMIRTAEWEPLTTALPDETLASWEAEFGDDPRYWQLRYWCSIAQIGTGLFVGAPRLDEEHCRYLRMGIERTGGDVQSYCCYAISLNPMDTDTESGIGVHPADLDQAVQMIKVLNDAVVAMPDEAWPYYMRAFIHWRMGDRVAALADWRAGNVAEKNTWPLTMYPASYVREQMRKRKLPGNPALCGVILGDSTATDLYLPHLLLKRMGTEVCEVVLETGNIELLNEYHLFLCRMWNSRGVDCWSMMCAASNDRALLSKVLCDPRFKLSTDQHNQLFKGAQRAQRLSLWLNEYPDPNRNLITRYIDTPWLLTALGLPYETGETYAEDWLYYQFWLKGRSDEFYEKLADLDLDFRWEQSDETP